MPIGPKHRLGETGPTVARQFTDRKRFIDFFEQAVSELPPREYKILVYYGVGGIGKTRLRTELSRLLEEQHAQTIWWAALDFYTPTHRDIETALFWLRQELKQKYEVQFPSFDLAYAIFWQKSRPQTLLRRESSGLEALTEEGSLFADLLSIVGQVPIVSLVPQISRTILKTNQLLKEWWTKRGRRELYELQEMTAAQITERLPMFWAADLKDSMQREGRPVVMFIDTYEALWEGVEGRFFSQDEWVRELVLQLPGVLWVITGRERLRWEELDEDWRNYQQQHLVGGLAENDARRFLASCGITEEALQEVIVEGSKGVPLYLDLAVEHYLQMKVTRQRAPSPSDFWGTPREVLERFLRYLDRSERETLKVLSATRFWDRTLFKLLIEEFNTGYPTTALAELCRFSFVQEEQTPGTWTIHPLMREAMEEDLGDELRGRVHRYLFDHYDQALQGLESTTIDDVHKRALTEAFHHGKHALATEELFDWFRTATQGFWRGALWQFLTPLHEEFAKLIEHRLGPERADTAASLNSLAMLYHKRGRYEEAESLYKRVLEVREKVLGPEHPDTATILNNLALLYHDRGRYEEAEPLLKRALEISEKGLGPEHPNTAAILYSLAGLHRDQGRYEEAKRLTQRPKLELYLADEDNQIVYEEDNSLAYIHATLANIGKTVANNVQGRMEFEPGRVYPIKHTSRPGWPKIDQHITATSDNRATFYLGSLVPQPYSTEHKWQARLFRDSRDSPKHFIVPVRVAAEGQTRLFCSFVCDEGSKVETSKLLDFPNKTRS